MTTDAAPSRGVRAAATTQQTPWSGAPIVRRPWPEMLTGEPVAFGPYDLVGPLATGGMSTVHLATERSTGARVALKILEPDLANHEVAVKRFYAELDVSRRVQHPGVLHIRARGCTAAGAPYLIMDLVDGELLADLVALPVATVAAIGAQIADAMIAMHDAGIIHGDLKPDNVLVVAAAAGPQVKVIDFGVARFLDGLPTDPAPHVCGTPRYMAPEQWSGHADHRSDIYALGCLLYEVITGRPPFDGRLPELMAAHVHNDAVPPSRLRPGLPGAFDALIQRMLAKDPDHRPPSMAEVARILVELASPT